MCRGFRNLKTNAMSPDLTKEKPDPDRKMSFRRKNKTAATQATKNSSNFPQKANTPFLQLDSDCFVLGHQRDVLSFGSLFYSLVVSSRLEVLKWCS